MGDDNTDTDAVDNFFEQQSCGDHEHDTEYAGFGDNYCNMCRCYSGEEVCTTQMCDTEVVGENGEPQLCASTTCKYGVRFTSVADNLNLNVNPDEIFTADEATEALFDGWADSPDVAFEFATKVMTRNTPDSGAKFSCGQAFQTTHEAFHAGELDECKCYCADDADSQNHIWHDAPRHADDIADDMLSNAGCACASSCANEHDSDGIGDQLIEGAIESLEAAGVLFHGHKIHDWCVVEETCQPLGSSVKASATWDYCSSFRAMHLAFATPAI
jgi:hypothetical protein